jgi:DNA (cytosine-5)-methyltransferase 1
MRYRSVCTGIAAETVAWHPLGWTALSFSEIDPFCCALLKARYPEVHNFGDFTKIEKQEQPTDLLMGGTPCQSFSIAGKRAGLDDPRGNLAIEFARLALRLRPRWIVWENVQGVLSSWDYDPQEDIERSNFDTFLEALAECGYGFAYRVLDAQFDGLAQRRKRVFVVGYLGDWRPPIAVLFEKESLRRDTAPGRKAGQEVAGTIGGRAGEGGPRQDLMLVDTLRSHPRPGSNTLGAVAYRTAGDGAVYESGEQSAPLTTGTDPSANVISFTERRREGGRNLETQENLAYTLRNPGDGGGGGSLAQVQIGTAVRRLTPLEWERLMGLPDSYTLIPYPRNKPAKDGPRYKAIGNSISVPTLRWIGRRIDLCDRLMAELLGNIDSMKNERQGIANL